MSPDANQLGVIAILIPVAGGLVVGLMARFGSEQIRDHGIPEALERIVVNGGLGQPRLAFLQPITSAVTSIAPTPASSVDLLTSSTRSGPVRNCSRRSASPSGSSWRDGPRADLPARTPAELPD